MEIHRLQSFRPIPRPASAQVWLDFDGTISKVDVLDKLIERFAANESWKLIEQRWQAGQIGSRECLQQEFALVRVTPAELNLFLSTIGVDPGLSELLQLLSEFNVPVSILSDGIDVFIHEILSRHGVEDLAVRSNTISHRGQRLKLRCPHSSSACESDAAHCKCASAATLGAAGRRNIYVGDGRSDLCPARKADLVFAKAALARSLAGEGIPFVPFVSLSDIAQALSDAWLGQTAVG
jgi:2,3-diketo-5-methylthio-1-phosphopentane phosphatase